MSPTGPRRLALIGFGSIGRQVALGIGAGRAGNAELVAVLTRRAPSAEQPFVASLSELLAARPNAVVEAASPSALADYALPVVESGASLVCASGSALVDPALREQLAEACRRTGARVHVPSGALAGLDALAAAASADLDDVQLRVVGTTHGLREEQVVFQGQALSGAAAFPDRANVAAATALLAERPVYLQLVEAPEDRPRQLELTARGAFGELYARVRPTPSVGRLSHVVALSLLASLRRLDQPIVFGG